MSPPTVWQRMIYAHRDRLERWIRSMHHTDSCGWTTHSLLGVSYGEFLARAKKDLIEDYLPRNVWEDPVV